MIGDDFLDDDLFADSSIFGADRLIEEIEAEWTAFQALVADLPEDSACVPGKVGEWSVKDVIAHIAAWEQEGARRIDVILHGDGESLSWPTAAQENEFNAQAVAASSGRSLADVSRSMVEAHQDLVDLLASFADELMTAPLQVPAAEWIPGWTYLHYQSHAPGIRALKNP